MNPTSFFLLTLLLVLVTEPAAGRPRGEWQVCSVGKVFEENVLKGVHLESTKGSVPRASVPGGNWYSHKFYVNISNGVGKTSVRRAAGECGTVGIANILVVNCEGSWKGHLTSRSLQLLTGLMVNGFVGSKTATRYIWTQVHNQSWRMGSWQCSDAQLIQNTQKDGQRIRHTFLFTDRFAHDTSRENLELEILGSSGGSSSIHNEYRHSESSWSTFKSKNPRTTITEEFYEEREEKHGISDGDLNFKTRGSQEESMSSFKSRTKTQIAGK